MVYQVCVRPELDCTLGKWALYKSAPNPISGPVRKPSPIYCNGPQLHNSSKQWINSPHELQPSTARK